MNGLRTSLVAGAKVLITVGTATGNAHAAGSSARADQQARALAAIVVCTVEGRLLHGAGRERGRQPRR